MLLVPGVNFWLSVCYSIGGQVDRCCKSPISHKPKSKEGRTLYPCLCRLKQPASLRIM